MAKTWCYYSAAVAFLFLHCAAAQTVYVVGEAYHWGVPDNPNFYSTWAFSKNFLINDVLSFHFLKGKDDVVEVTKEAYETCSKANDTGNAIAKFPPCDYTLNKTGFHYFICTLGDQCSKGQKLAVNVVSNYSTPSTPTSAAPPVLAAGSFLITLSFVLGKLVL